MFVAGAEKRIVFGLVADFGISARDAGPLIVARLRRWVYKR